MTSRVALGAVIGLASFVAAPLPDDLLTVDAGVQILARDGSDLAESRASDGSRRWRLTPGAPVPAHVAAAFVAVEDQRFGHHVGVDLRGIARAVRDSVRAGRIVSGASTITQQLARLLGKRRSGPEDDVGLPRAMLHKAGEALWAIRLQTHLDDEVLLRAYLDRVPLGRNAIGVEAAAAVYFGLPAERLSWAQAALLAGLAHAPAREDPFRHPEAARARRDFALKRLRQLGVVDDDALHRAEREPLPIKPTPLPNLHAPHLVARLRQEARHARLARVETTIDAHLQRDLEEMVQDEVRRGPHLSHGLKHAGIIVVDNRSREILARIGSADFFDVRDLGMNDATVARRQPGSTLKPFFYARAFERGLTAGTILKDVATALAVDDDATYTPQNYDRRQHGPVPARVALQNSYNVPAVEVARRIGPEDALQVLRRAGFAGLEKPAGHYGVGLVLGNGEVTLEELATAYVGLANGGLAAPLVQIRRRCAHDGVCVDVEQEAPPTPTRFLREDSVALVTDILRDDPARAPAFGFDNALDLPFDVAAKTGTSRSYVDNWTAGFTAERTVVVWAGSFDGTPMKGVSGVSGAGVLFRRAMVRAMEDVAHPAPLVDARRFETHTICPVSGLLAGPGCPHLAEHFLPGTAPGTTCTSHAHYEAKDVFTTGGDVCTSGEPPLTLDGPLYTWATREGRCVRERPLGDDERPRLLSPRDGEIYVRDPGIPDDAQPVPLRYRAGPQAKVVVDGVAVDEHADGLDGGRFLSLSPGTHIVELWDGDAPAVVVDTARIEIR